MAWIGALVGVAGSYLSSQNQANAAQSAANSSSNAASNAADLQNQQYVQTRTDQAPWRLIGTSALNQLAGGGGNFENGAYAKNGLADQFTRPFGMSDFQQDPGYQFRLSEGLKTLQNSAAARGGLLSGNALRGISRYGQDYASNEYQNAYNRYNTNQTNSFNRLASIAGIGQTANNALQQSGQNYANQTGGIMMGNAANQGNAALAAGQARASMYGGMSNALGRINWGGGSSQPVADNSAMYTSNQGMQPGMSTYDYTGG